MDGCDLLKALRMMGRYRHIPLVICYTSSQASDIAKCMAAGASLYLPKPRSIDGLDLISAQVKPYVLN